MRLALACYLAFTASFAKPATIEEIAWHGHVLTPADTSVPKTSKKTPNRLPRNTRDSWRRWRSVLRKESGWLPLFANDSRV